MRRFVIFLGLFSAITLVLLVAAAALVEHGSLRTQAHADLGWGFAIPFAAYLALSLRELVRGKS